MKKSAPDATQTDEETAEDYRNNDGEISNTNNNPNLIAEEPLPVTIFAEAEGLAENKLPQNGQMDSGKDIVERDIQAHKKGKEKTFLDDECKQSTAPSDSVASTTRYDETLLSTITGDTDTCSVVKTQTTPASTYLPSASEENDHGQQSGPSLTERALDTFPALERQGAGVTEQRRSSTRGSSNAMVVATVVEEDEDTLPIVYPTSVKTGESIRRKRRKLLLIFGFLVCTLTGLIVVLIVSLGSKESDTGKTTNDASEQKSENWAERDSLKCGVLYQNEGLGYLNKETGKYYGLVIDLCYAVAAALFGEGYRDRVIFKGEEVSVVQSAFSALKNKEVDLLIRSITHTMQRQVYIANFETGFSFTAPYHYTGLTYGGDPHFVKCMDDANFSGNCSGLKVCVQVGTTHVKIVKDRIDEANFVEVHKSSLEHYYGYLNTAACNVITGETIISKRIAKAMNISDHFEVSGRVLSNEPLAMVTLHNEPQWSDFVNWVLQALFVAEKYNITQKAAHEMPTTDVFGEKFKNMFVNAISAVGNYGEIYSRHMEAIFPRQNVNTINNGSSGLIYHHPFGRLDDDAPSGHTKDGILESIFQRGYLKCGVIQHGTLDGSGTEANLLSGLSADYFYALSAGIFHDNKTKMISISPTEVAALLNRKEVDVISPVAVNLVNDVAGNMSFSQPIYYNSQNVPLALATFQDDVQWSSFVYWTVSATFYAEEKKYSYNTSKQMPLLNLFGPHHKMMLQNIIAAVGNYGDIFERNNGTLGHRDGLNLLNSNNGPQIYPFPGIID